MNEPSEAPGFLVCVSRGVLARLVVVAFAAIIVFYSRRVFLVVFGGVLLAIVLRALAALIARYTFIGPKRSYVALLILMLIIAFGAGYLLGPRILAQGQEIVKAIPGSIGNVRSTLDQYQSGRNIIKILDRSVQIQRMGVWATKFASSAVDLITDAVVLLVIGLFLAANPPLYRRGLLHLVPADRREHTSDLLTNIGRCLTGWFFGQLIPMSVLGIATFIGLWLLGIPLAFTLALFTSLMLFVPYVGSVIAFIPTALIAFTKCPVSMLYVTALYLGVHIAEGYVITPLAQRYAVRLPPALTLFSQLFMWKVAGILGVLVATPLAAAILVIVQKSRNFNR